MTKIKWNNSSFNTWYALAYFIDANLFCIERRGHRGQYTYTLYYLHPSWTIHSISPGWKQYSLYPSLELAKNAAQKAYNKFAEKIMEENNTRRK